jgi:hypothetical protein
MANQSISNALGHWRAKHWLRKSPCFAHATLWMDRAAHGFRRTHGPNDRPARDCARQAAQAGKRDAETSIRFQDGSIFSVGDFVRAQEGAMALRPARYRNAVIPHLYVDKAAEAIAFYARVPHRADGDRNRGAVTDGALHGKSNWN